VGAIPRTHPALLIRTSKAAVKNIEHTKTADRPNTAPPHVGMTMLPLSPPVRGRSHRHLVSGHCHICVNAGSDRGAIVHVAL